MKKSKLFLISLVALPLLVACSSETFKPTHEYPGDPLSEPEPNMTVNFYLNYSNSEESGQYGPRYSMKWFMLSPLETIPEEAKLTNADAPDPLYPKFLGYSEFPTCLDESRLWNFATDVKQSNILNLYGIWVSE